MPESRQSAQLLSAQFILSPSNVFKLSWLGMKELTRSGFGFLKNKAKLSLSSAAKMNDVSRKVLLPYFFKIFSLSLDIGVLRSWLMARSRRPGRKPHFS